MSKQLRGVLLAVVVLAVAVAAYVILLNVLKSPEEEGGESSVSSETASETSSDDTESETVLYLYEHDTETFVSAEVTTFLGEVYHVEKDGDTYSIPEIEDFSHYTSNIKICADRLSAYTIAEKVTDNATEEELAGYGLTEAKAKASVTFSDGSSLTLLVGNKNDDGYYYICREGSRTVGLTATGISSYFLRGRVNFLKCDLFSCSEERITGIDNIEFVDTQEEYPVRVGKTNGDKLSALALSTTYYLTYPTTMSVNTEALDDGLTALSGFACDGAIEIISDTTDLSQYGLDEPRYTLSFTYQKPLSDEDSDEVNTNPVENYRFFISDVTEAGLCYVLPENGSVIYYFTKEAYSFMTWTLESMAGSTFLSPMIKYLDSMTVTYGNREYRFLFTEGDGSISAVTYLDRQLDVDNFKKFYQVVLGTGWIAFGEKEEGAEPYLTISFDYQDEFDKADDVMTFYPYSLRQYAVEINGEGAFTVPKTRLDKVVNDLNKVINNETVTAFVN